LCLGDDPLNYYPGNGPADPRFCKGEELYLLPAAGRCTLCILLTHLLLV
jgi:hypothetical protein